MKKRQNNKIINSNLCNLPILQAIYLVVKSLHLYLIYLLIVSKNLALIIRKIIKLLFFQFIG